MEKTTTNGEWATVAEGSVFKAIVDMHPESILVVGDDGKPLYANTSAAGLLSRLADGGDRLPGAVSLPMGDGARVTLSDLTGAEIVLAVRTQPIRWHGRHARLLYVTDETRQTRRHESLERLAYSDHLTGLYNRRGLELVAEHHALVAARARAHLVAFFIDLDRLKHINDTFGHQTGDEALLELASVVCTVFRDSDIKARVGGDEFVVLVNEDAPGRVDHLLARISTEVDRRNAAAGRDHTLSISIGIARHEPSASLDIGKLLAEADQSMYVAKRRDDLRTVGRGDQQASAPVAGAQASITGPSNRALMFLGL